MILDFPWTNAVPIAVTGLAIVYGLLCTILWHLQTGLVFRPYAEIAQTPTDYGLNYREVWIPVGDGKLNAWWIGSETALDRSSDERITLYFHGNRGNIGSRLNLDRIAAFQRTWGGAFFIADYRGFGQSIEGPPSEDKLYEDLEAIWGYLTETEQIAPERIALYGHSLGGAAAIALANRHPQVRAIVIDSSFTTIANVARKDLFFRLFPLRAILRHRFESIDKVAALTMPTLYVHGTEDTVVPTDMSEVLHAATPEPSELRILSGVDHEDVLETADDEFLGAIADFYDRADRLLRSR
ncbi:MAG: alpha/beta hydrolase [Geitlerinemataceae cyanobacterium]